MGSVPPSGGSSGVDPRAGLADRLAGCRADAMAVARVLVDRQDAEDVVQEAILRVLRAAGRGAVIEEPRLYLHAVVRHVAADHLRATWGERPWADVPERATRHGDPQAAIELREVLDAIEGLPAAQRRALLGTALAAHDQRQIARLLETTPAAVRQLVRRARQRLQDTVGAWVPWLGHRAGELVAAVATGGGTRSGALVVAMAAVVLPSTPAAPHPPTPAKPSLVQAAIAPSAPLPPRLAAPPQVRISP